MIGGLPSIVDRDCQLHAVCLDCCAFFASSRLLKGSLLRAVPRNEEYLLHDDLRHFEVAAQLGCHFCSLLWERFKDPSPDPEARVYVLITKRYRCETEIYVTVAPLLGLYLRGLLPRYSGTKFETSSSPGKSTRSFIDLQRGELMRPMQAGSELRTQVATRMLPNGLRTPAPINTVCWLSTGYLNALGNMRIVGDKGWKD